ncbi:MAG: TonB-dependent receptor [Steroidobacteraceae bacterium]|nr:TonB-dependent receptor [Steroidobacteraceae bacterium]
MSTSTVRRAVARVLKGAVALSVGFGATALAQTAGDGAADGQIQEVRVTGSRIQRDGMTTPTPVTSVSMDDLHVLAPTTLGAAVTQLPQFINSSVPEGAPSSGWTGASGASILNLRGVGENRTLVLLDGRRVVPSSRRGTLDVNLLPEPLVSRVEVVTGGASAAYGSDAVSGVVNFLLDTEFTGFKSNIQGGVTELGDNENYSVQLSGGMPLGERMHIIASADYYHVDPIKDATARDWQQSWGVIPNPRANEPGQPARITRPNVRSRQFTEGGLILSGPLAFTQFLPGGVPAPFVAGEDVSSTAQVGGDGYDLAWFNYFTPETTRGSGFAHLTFEINDNASAFIQGLYGANDTTYLSPPAGAQFATWAATIYPDNAFLPDSIREQMGGQSFRFGRAGDLDYGASKAITQENRLRSFTTGVKAQWGDWRLDAYYQYGKTDSVIRMDNAIRLDRVYQAIDAVRAPSGEIVCNSTLMYPDNGCVPMNVFGVGSPSQEAIDWITQDISQKQVVEQHVADIAISGVPFDNWVGPVSVATGVSWRRDAFRQDVYPVELHEGTDMPVAGPSLGYRGLPGVYSGNANIFERGPSASPRGSYDVKEVFAEMQMPLLGETALTRSLEVNTAVRFADYEGSGGVWAWKAGLDWQVTDALRFRFTRSRDVRAGTLSERFDSSRGPGNVTDPTTGSATPYAISVIAGGNPEVDPEKADTVTFGVVYQPAWLEGFAVSVDAFDIDIDGAIGQLGAQEIVDQCYAGATQLCQYIERGEDGFISIVKNLFINTDQSKTRGIDLEASYTRPLELFGGGESLSARLLTTFIDELSTTQAGAAKVDRAGQTGVAGGAPDWQATLSLTYERGAFSATLQERYIASGLYDATWIEGVDIDDNTVDASLITNLQLAYNGDLTDRGTYRVSLNVSNLLDEDPPLAAAWGFTGSRDTNSSLFDIYGRRYTLGVRFNF